MRFIAAYIMQGRMQAMLVASTLAILSLLFPPVSIVSSGTVALVTLRRGANEGLLVLLCSCAASALLGIVLLNNVYFALLYGLALWLPVWVIAVVLREGRHLSLTIEIAVFIGMAMVIGFYLYNGNTSAMWQGLLEQMAQALLQKSPDVPLEKIQQSIAVLARFMTGIFVSGTVYSMLFGLFLGRWWQSVLYNPGGFREEYLKLRVGLTLALASLVIIGIAWAGLGVFSEVAQNICVLLFVLYTVIGTAVLHAVFSNMSANRFLVPMLYLTLIIIPHTMLLVALIGLADVWLNLRNKQFNRNGA
ncbi:MAG: DUF2232 domain-containing protein [Methylococcaceae bacterium]|nr:DUF2232 domain-containing protein [Methylococcaceae bacterium]